MEGMHGDDPVLAVLRYAPFLFVIVGVGLVIWLSRQRLPYELQPDVLAALSDTEALPTSTIRQRPPLAYQNVDLKTLGLVLDRLCNDGLVVRWYEVVEVTGSSLIKSSTGERQAVYRRVSSGAG
jgi:hypothetical protein